MDPTREASAHAARPSADSQSEPVVFVVDDDVSVRESLESLIRWEGWQVETFASAREFLSHPPGRAPSCLVLDVSLPDLNGLDLQRAIAADRSDMPIIFITGYGNVPMSDFPPRLSRIGAHLAPPAYRAVLRPFRRRT